MRMPWNVFVTNCVHKKPLLLIVMHAKLCILCMRDVCMYVCMHIKSCACMYTNMTVTAMFLSFVSVCVKETHAQRSICLN